VLTIDLDNSEVEPYLDKAYRQAVRRLNIPGFRKGKAPRRIVEQMFGREYLINEALDNMIQDVTTKAVEQEKLELGGIPSVSIENIDPPSFVATVPLVPQVELGDWESVRVEKKPVEVKAEQVDSVLEQLRQQQAVWEPAEGPVQMDDLIELTVEGWLIEDEETDNRRQIVLSENTEYIPRAGTRFPVPGFDEALAGLPVGEKTEFTIDVPEDFENAEYAGKKAVFEATVHQVKRKNPPALDDEFAKGVGDGYESLEALRKTIEDDLRKREENAVESVHQDEVLNKLVEGATIEMSPLIINHELEHYVHDRQEEFKAGRFTSIEDYQQAIAWQAMSDDELHESVRPTVEQRLKRAHVLREVAKAKSLEATDEELDAEIEEMAGDAGESADQVRRIFQDPERRESLRRVLVNRKTLKHISELAAQADAPAKSSRKKAATASTSSEDESENEKEPASE
jgi:trigger factor